MWLNKTDNRMRQGPYHILCFIIQGSTYGTDENIAIIFFICDCLPSVFKFFLADMP